MEKYEYKKSVEKKETEKPLTKEVDKTISALKKILPDTEKSIAFKNKKIDGNVGVYRVNKGYVVLLKNNNPKYPNILKVRIEKGGLVEVSEKTQDGKDVQKKVSPNIQKNALKTVWEAIEGVNDM